LSSLKEEDKVSLRLFSVSSLETEEPLESSLSNPFKNITGSFYTKALFYETTMADKATVVYTLKDEDHKGFPSLYRLYLETRDPTEYLFANKYLGGWKHWQELCECTWFAPYVARWRQELELSIKAEALSRLLEESENTLSKKYVDVNRYLLEKGWVEKESTSKGRPSKQQVKDEAVRLAKESSQVEDDFARLVN
jgi:hypothetical protein